MTLFRARIYSPLARASESPSDPGNHLWLEDGYLRVEKGRIAGVGPWERRSQVASSEDVVNLGPDKLLTPGLVDTHLHAPQLQMIGSYGGHLLEWLNRYTFPTEARFVDDSYAQRVATALFDDLLRNGTLSALIFSSIHQKATERFFEAAERRGFRAIIGKTMMDRNAPPALTETADQSYTESRELLLRWKGRGLLRYAITPRFAPTSSEYLLELAGELKREFPDVHVQSHISENAAEVAWVRQLYPDSKHYADVYDRAGLLSSRTVLAHGVHLTDAELILLAERKVKIAHCPNSNLFLGSGLFPLRRVQEAGIGVGLGSDIGAGTTPSMFNAMADAYKIQQVQGVSLSPFELWYLATLGGATALSMEQETGSLEVGKSADLLVLNLKATPLLALRTERVESFEELLAGLIFMGDDRLVETAYIQGRVVSAQSPSRGEGIPAGR